MSPVTLTEQVLDDIDRWNPALNAYRTVLRHRAMVQAQTAHHEVSNGLIRGPLHGIPYSVKDVFDVKGTATTAGSALLENNVAQRDASVVQRLDQQGMILVGKTNLVEFALGTTGINHVHGTPRNPWRSEPHIPGGSSSGSAVAVAAGLAPVSLGTDVGGSVRGPAALCGIVGLKTTSGRISREGVLSSCWTLDTVGILTRCVDDAALVYASLHNPDDDDRDTWGTAQDSVLGHIAEGVDGLRLAIPEGLLFEDLDPEVEESMRSCCLQFEELGANIRRIHLEEAEHADRIFGTIPLVEAHVAHERLLASGLDQTDPWVGPRIVEAASIPAPRYAHALREMTRLRAAVHETMHDIDALIAPTTAMPALPLSVVEASFDDYIRATIRYRRNTAVANLLNLCGVSIPCGQTRNGLPIGFSVLAKPFHERTALRIARAYESATNWHRRFPDLSELH